MSVNICFVYLGAPYWVHRYLQVLYFLALIPLPLCNVLLRLCLTVFVLKSILSKIYIATPTFFSFPFAWNVFFYPFMLSLSVSLDLKWVSCSHHINGSGFFFSTQSPYIFWLEHLAHLYLKYFGHNVLIAILLFVFWFLFCFVFVVLYSFLHFFPLWFDDFL